MTNKENQKQYKVFIKNLNQWVEVSKEVYLAYYKDIWKTRSSEQKKGNCICPKRDIWTCDGDCLVCKYHKAHNTLSIDETILENNNDTSIESIVEDCELIIKLLERLEELSPECK